MDEVIEMTLPEFSKAFSMSRTSFDRYVHRAENPLPAYKRGRLWIINIAEYMEWRDAENKRCRS